MKIIRKSVSVVLSLIMVISLFTILQPETFAASGVEYIECSYNSSTEKVEKETKTCSSYNVVGSQDSLTMSGGGWYVVDGDAEIKNRVNISGAAHIILKSGTLTCKNGIHLSEGNELYIYSAKDSSGTLQANKSDTDSQANIGGNDDEQCGRLEFHGGTLKAEKKQYSSSAAIGGGRKGSCGSLNFYGGTVSAKVEGLAAGERAKAAAIGYGREAKIGNNCAINIYGGTISALAGTTFSEGAGIGGGKESECCPINILGGKVKATAYDSAAIGGGEGDTANTITIKNAEVDAQSRDGAAIGAGQDSSAKPIVIERSNVKAITKAKGIDGDGAGIGGGNNGSSESIKIKKSVVCAATQKFGAGIGGGDEGNGGNIEIKDSVVFAHSSGGGAGIGGGDQNGCDNIDIKGSVVVATTGTSTTSKDNALKVLDKYSEIIDKLLYSLQFGENYSEYYSMGYFTAMLFDIVISGKHTGAGIGGGENGTPDNITIDNSTVYATGDDDAAGIGGGDGGGFGTITIKNDSHIYAKSDEDAAGIGTGNKGKSCGVINISDSEVEAISGDEGAGIGTGNNISHGEKAKINISKSTIKAYGGSLGAGIGSGDDTDVDYINIENSKVDAYGGHDAAGIGGGEDGNGGTIYIKDSDVYASGSHYGAGIGGGEDEGVKKVSILGSKCKVIADAGSSGYGVAVGNGDYDKIFHSRPSYGARTIYNSMRVKAGKNSDSLSEYSGDERFKAMRENKYAVIYSCEHANTVYQCCDLQNHQLYCNDCNQIIGSKTSHSFDSNEVCTICGVKYDPVEVKIIEQDNSGEKTTTEKVQKSTKFEAPEPEYAPDGKEFVCVWVLFPHKTKWQLPPWVWNLP